MVGIGGKRRFRWYHSHVVTGNGMSIISHFVFFDHIISLFERMRFPPTCVWSSGSYLSGDEDGIKHRCLFSFVWLAYPIFSSERQTKHRVAG